ncbi:MAG: hypothetical protein EOP10_21270 [Proteobacteria bacterium]|nr:MAG: hypothetical protein EOP10_21270 [Pseudomonadota bacterium]
MLFGLVIPTAACLLVALAFGPMVLLIAPFLFGIGHMSSTSQVLSHLWTREISRGQEWTRFFVFGVFVVFGLMKLSPYRIHLYPNGIPLPEIALLVAFISFGLYASRLRSIQAFVLPIGCIAALFYAPIYAFAGLLFLHNLIAFYYWWALASQRETKNLALLGSCLAIGIASVIAAGWLDFIFFAISSSFNVQGLLVSSKATAADWARTVMPFLNNPIVIYRFVVIAAFGQLIHYYIWLKSIPRLGLPKALPQGVNHGTRIIFAGAGLCLLTLAILDPGLARIVYVALAAAHGLVELGTLPLLTSRQPEGKLWKTI